MASIEARGRKDGTIGYRVDWMDPDHPVQNPKSKRYGKPGRRSLTFDDRREAERLVKLLDANGQRLADAAATLKAIRENKSTVAEMIEDHIKHLTGIEEATRFDYRRMADNHIIPVIGGLPAESIARDRIRLWVNQVSVPDPIRAGAVLTVARKDADLSREQLAEQLGWTAKKIAGYEAGRTILDDDELTAVFVALRVPRARRPVISTIAHGMGAKTLRNVHSILSASFTWANVERKLRSDNPAKNLRLPKYTPAEMCFLTPAEFGLLVRRFREPYQLMVRFLAGTGVRWGELIALTVGDVHLDVEYPYVSVNKAVKRKGGSGTYVGAPKTNRSRRLVSLPPSLVAPLRLVIGERDDSVPLFLGPKGGRVAYSHFYTTHWAPAVAAVTAKTRPDGTPLPRGERLTKTSVRIHDLRHTQASWLIAEGVDLPTVQRRLGHESIVTTVDRYGHLDPKQLREAATAADAMLAKAGTSPLAPVPGGLAPVIDLEDIRLHRHTAASDTDPAADGDPSGVQPVTTPALAQVPDVGYVPDNVLRDAIGQELECIRQLRRWSRVELVDRLPAGLTFHATTLAGYESGERQLPAARFLHICQVLGVPAALVIAQAMQRVAAGAPTGEGLSDAG